MKARIFPRKIGSSPRRRKTLLGEGVRLGEGWFTQANPGAKLDVALVRLGELKSSYCKLLGDCLKSVCGLFEACHIACFGGYCGRFCEHTICHIWFDD